MSGLLKSGETEEKSKPAQGNIPDITHLVGTHGNEKKSTETKKKRVMNPNSLAALAANRDRGRERIMENRAQQRELIRNNTYGSSSAAVQSKPPTTQTNTGVGAGGASVPAGGPGTGTDREGKTPVSAVATANQSGDDNKKRRELPSGGFFGSSLRVDTSDAALGSSRGKRGRLPGAPHETASRKNIPMDDPREPLFDPRTRSYSRRSSDSHRRKPTRDYVDYDMDSGSGSDYSSDDEPADYRYGDARHSRYHSPPRHHFRRAYDEYDRPSARSRYPPIDDDGFDSADDEDYSFRNSRREQLRSARYNRSRMFGGNPVPNAGGIPALPVQVTPPGTVPMNQVNLPPEVLQQIQSSYTARSNNQALLAALNRNRRL